VSIYGDIRFRDFGSALVCLQGEDGKKIRDKSTDHAFIIRDRSERPDNHYPCFVIEIGYSENQGDQK
jgi:hypothetical protein